LEFIGFILVTILTIVISPLLKGLVNKFVEEDKLEEEENKKRNKKNKIEEKSKVKFVPEFDWKITGLTVLAEIILFIKFGVTAQFFVYSFLTLLLVIAMFADIKGYIIPNEINFVGFLAGIILTFLKFNVNVNSGLDSIAGMLVGFLVFLAIAGLSILLFKREGMGGGDIKLMGVIGLYLGFFNNIQVFILSFFIAAIISIFLLATKIKKSDDYIPFGPFIVIAAYITMLFPASITMPMLFEILG